MRLYVRLLIGVLRRSMRLRRDLLMENLMLRQQLAVYARQPKRPRLRNEDRLFWSVVARTWSPWRSRLRLVQPETVVRWHRTAWRRSWEGKTRSSRSDEAVLASDRGRTGFSCPTEPRDIFPPHGLHRSSVRPTVTGVYTVSSGR